VSVDMVMAALEYDKGIKNELNMKITDIDER
jgi:hypothetical protein